MAHSASLTRIICTSDTETTVQAGEPMTVPGDDLHHQAQGSVDTLGGAFLVDSRHIILRTRAIARYTCTQ